MRILGALMGAALISSAALAQTIVIEPETRTQIREYVVKHKPGVTVLPKNIELRSGVVLPDTVELHSFDGVTGATEYRYVVVDGRTAVVEPGTRRIIEVID